MSRADPKNKRAGRHGGRHAIAGFLFQVLRSLTLGLRTSISLSGEGDGQTMRLTLEPDDGGDHQLSTASEAIIEQIKLRSKSKSWSSPEVSRTIIPDLLQAAQSDKAQRFRFVTDNPSGLSQLRNFLALRGSPESQMAKLRWGGRPVTVAEFEASLARQAGTSSDDPRLAHLLSNLAVDIVDMGQAEDETERFLRPLLQLGESATAKRRELMTALLEAGRAGRTISARELLLLVSEQALERLTLVQTLRSTVPAQAASDAAGLAYDEPCQSRLSGPRVQCGFSILTGESGQGKTWSLCQVALAEAREGKLVIITPALATVADLEALVNLRLWLPAYSSPTSLSNIRRRLAPYFADDEGYWLTLYVDDIQDRGFARELARRDWRAEGIRIVVSCQPRITAVFAGKQGTETLPVADFSSSELRRFLAHYQVDAPLETMPDDVFELLLKPIHARVFTRLTHGRRWTGKTEYELFQAYWREACHAERNQRDHPFDQSKLVDLASLLLSPINHYPWTVEQVRASGIDEQALVRLEQVGLLRWREGETLEFSADRMLNWAVAEAVVRQIERDQLTPDEAGEMLAKVDELKTADGTKIGLKLGYVLMDVLWLLCERMPAAFTADLLLQLKASRKAGWHDSEMWSGQIATVGASMLPVLQTLSSRQYGDRDWEMRRNIVNAAIAIGEADAAAVQDFVSRLLQSGDERATAVAINVSAHISCPAAIDWIWRVVLARDEAYRHERGYEGDSDEKADLWRDRNQATKALHLAISRNFDWLDNSLCTDRPGELELLLMALVVREGVPFQRARACWGRHKTRLLQLLPVDSYALSTAIGDFGDPSLMDWLEGVPRDPKKFTSARAMRSRALLDPTGALQLVASGNDRHDWVLADWWLPELARHDPAGLTTALQARVGESDDPLTEMILSYRNFPSAMTSDGLNWVLDRTAERLAERNSQPCEDERAHIKGLGHALRYLAGLNLPWQMAQLAKRAGTPFEKELATWACSRHGRASRYRDHEGNQCERILAAIGDKGFDRLVMAELARDNTEGRADGYELACWSDSASVRDALANIAEPEAPDTYHQVIRMEALAIHQCDNGIERMVRAGCPVFVNAADMRADEDRPAEPLEQRILALRDSDDDRDHQLAAQLAGFMPGDQAGDLLLPPFLRPQATTATRQAIVATFQAAGFYDPSMLDGVIGLLSGQPDRETHFVALYLARCGDADARRVLREWMAGRNLGDGSASDRSYLQALARHADSRASVAGFLRKSRANGHLLVDGWQLQLMADEGDVEAQLELTHSAYRSPAFGTGPRLTAIRYMQRVDRDEALFCARRMWAKKRSPAAIDLMLEIDAEQALSLLLRLYVDASYSERLEIARRLRSAAPLDKLTKALASLAVSPSMAERIVAAELAGWLPPGHDFEPLPTLEKEEEPAVVEAARDSILRRANEAAALEHLQLMATSTKAQQWARLQAIFKLVDPYILWRSNDPLSLGPFLERHPHEFYVEAEQIKKRRESKLENEAKRRDRADR